MTDHADFLSAPEEHRWTKPLDELGIWLREASWRAKGDWVWRILPGGACVAMRVIPDGPNAFRKELRVSRREKLETQEAVKKWLTECKVFRAHLGCAIGWHTTSFGDKPTDGPIVPEVGIATAWTMIEDTPLQTQKGRIPPELLKCSQCGAQAEPGSEKYKAILCNKCATAAGSAETKAHVEQQTLRLT